MRIGFGALLSGLIMASGVMASEVMASGVKAPEANSEYVGENPKREFRGAWLHVIGQSQWQNMNSKQQMQYVEDQFQKLQDAGCNAVIFQVRPTADAVYKSDLEPWSAWLTGKRGKAPDTDWDPMAYAIEEAHKRGMEFHAWLNPYRVTSSMKDVLPASHIANKEPHRFVKFNGQTFFDPAYRENRDFICDVVRDIVDRYDVDAIHIDDYFYPYPANGKKFNGDDASYKKFGNGIERNEWRRHNVDLLIEQLYTTIKTEKPWVRFGVSPFGIWRNKASDPRGSNSSGLQNYDDLYADVLLWAKNGWIDYIAPQLYWTLDMKAAPSRHLAQWWNDNCEGVDVYIGQDVQRTMTNADPKTGDKNELATKVRISRELPNVKGNVWWHGYWVTENLKGVADSLALKHQSTIALPPAYGDPDVRPEKVRDLKMIKEDEKTFITWMAPASSALATSTSYSTAPSGRGPKHERETAERETAERETAERDGGAESETDVVKYLVYQFFPGETISLGDAQTIIAMTPFTRVLVDGDDLPGSTFVVTSVDRMNRESDPVAIRIK